VGFHKWLQQMDHKKRSLSDIPNPTKTVAKAKFTLDPLRQG